MSPELAELGLRSEDEVVRLIATLSLSQYYLAQNARIFQELVYATRHEKKEAVENADDLTDVLEILIKQLKARACAFPIVTNPKPKGTTSKGT